MQFHPSETKHSHNLCGPLWVQLSYFRVMNLSQGYAHAKQALDNALAGYCCPDEQFKPFIEKTIDDFLAYLRDPKLPLDEMREVMASVQGRIPYKVSQYNIGYEH